MKRNPLVILAVLAALIAPAVIYGSFFWELGHPMSLKAIALASSPR